MALKQSFFDLLEHIGTTSTTSDLFHAKPDANIVAMRHDVDHDLELALEMAHHEWRLGYKATYYLLHTESYWDDEKFPLLVRQLKEYGHEVGLHVNSYSSWITGQCKDPNLEIKNALERLRECGIEISGVCAHGDKLCYKHGFINYWMWKELRGDQPEVTEEGMSAEGIRVNDEAYKIPYPISHSLVREDGQSIPLWNLSMEEHSIDYDAAHLSQDFYWSDSGGEWTRSGSPMDSDLSKGRHQVLVHPWWWRGKPKSIFVMSPARSGSKWLANYIDKATSAVGLHEWTLNHQREGNNFVESNRTSKGFQSLLDDSKEVESRLKAARAHRIMQKRDVVECNVYTPSCMDAFSKILPDSIVIMLNRDSKEIIRSLVTRDWFETSIDLNHVQIKGVPWNQLNQLDKAGAYVSSVKSEIRRHSILEISFAQMLKDPNYLPKKLSELGIVVHPLLSVNLGSEFVNANAKEVFKPVDTWDELTVERVETAISGRSGVTLDKTKSYVDFDHTKWNKFSAVRMNAKRTLRGISCTALHPNPTLTLFGSEWNSLKTGGVYADSLCEYRFSFKLIRVVDPIRVYVVGYSKTGDVLERKHVTTFYPNSDLSPITFSPNADWHKFSIAFFVETKKTGLKFRVSNVSLTKTEVEDGYRATSTLPVHSSFIVNTLARISEEKIREMRVHHSRKKRYKPEDYRFLLSEFLGKYETLTLNEYVHVEDFNNRKILLIRHDVDHDYETAMQIAEWEHEHGIKATYCLLHTAWYWGIFQNGSYKHYAELVEFGNRLLDLGHEINLHNNFVSLALTDDVDPRRIIREELSFLNELGWRITGTTLHGDRLCGEYNYNNAELFCECVKEERGGPRDLVSPNGKVSLGSLSYCDFQLLYEAYDIKRDLYITDSGGRLRCMKNAPGRRDFGRKQSTGSSVVGILTHPVWWDFS